MDIKTAVGLQNDFVCNPNQKNQNVWITYAMENLIQIRIFSAFGLQGPQVI